MLERRNLLPVPALFAALLLSACTAKPLPDDVGQASSQQSLATSSSSAAQSSQPASSLPVASSSSSAASSSSAPPEPAPIATELESYCAANGALESQHAGFSGAGYINSDNVAGAQISWRINNPTSKAVTLRFRYAAPADRAAKVLINDQTVGELAFSSTGDWATWQEATLAVNLPAGSQLIQLVATNNAGLANIDTLVIEGAEVTLEPCKTGFSLSGSTALHDPSTVLKEDGVYWTFGTEQGIPSRFSYDLQRWHTGPTVFEPGTWPDWISEKVTNFEGMFWAPDIIHMNGRYYLYYSAFFATNAPGDFAESAIGVAVTDSLNNPNWQDLGVVVDSKTHPRGPGNDFVNCIDAGIYRDADGGVWMTYGSHFGGIYTLQLNPATGKPLNNERTLIAGVGDQGLWTEYEAAQVLYKHGFYHLFINLGACCEGADSNYTIMVGRSQNPNGPFTARDGRPFYGPDLLSQPAIDAGDRTGATLADDGIYIGPGHFGYINHYGQDLATIHYYDGRTADGWPARIDLLALHFDSEGWPYFERGFELVTPAPVARPIIAGGAYVIAPKSNRAQVLDLANCQAQNGNTTALWGDLNNTCQQWVFTEEASNIYSLRSAVDPRFALEVTGSDTGTGAAAQLWQYNSGQHQQFELLSHSDGSHSLKARHSGLCLALENGSTANGTALVQTVCADAAAQRLILK